MMIVTLSIYRNIALIFCLMINKFSKIINTIITIHSKKPAYRTTLKLFSVLLTQKPTCNQITVIKPKKIFHEIQPYNKIIFITIHRR